MNTRNVIGRRIVAVRQTRTGSSTGPSVDVSAIVLDNGYEIRPNVVETNEGGDYLVEMMVVKSSRAE